MKILLLVLLLTMSAYGYPLQEVEDIKLVFPGQQQDIFIDYRNENFSQTLTVNHDKIYAAIECTNYLDLNLEFRVLADEKLFADIHGEMREVIRNLFPKDPTVKNYLTNISYYLKENIRYSDAPLAQDAESVLLNKKASCIGYSNLVKLFLDCAGIRNQMVRGFYLKKIGVNSSEMIPVPHRWVEIELPNTVKFYYDPQYQRFSVNYITTRNDTNFKRIKKFKVHMVNKSKKISN